MMNKGTVDKATFDKDLFSPQLQARAGILIVFAGALQRLLKASWPLFLYLIFRISKSETFELNGWLVTGLVLLFLSGLLLYAWRWYKNFRFYIDPDEQVFILEKGIWNKKKTIIQLNKVQQVNTSQHVIQQLLDVHALEVETAGSSEPEVRIKAVTQATAAALKAYLMREEQPESPDDENAAHREASHEAVIPETTETILSIPLRRLFLFGISTNYIESFFVLAGFFFTLYDDFKNFVSRDQTTTQLRELTGPLSSTLSYLLLLIGLLLLIFVFNLIRSVLPYYDFHIFRKKEGLHLTYGLLKQKSLLLRIRKIKLVRLSQNPIQALWGLHRLTVHQSISPQQQEQSSTITIPACTDAEAGHLTDLFFAGQPQHGQKFRPDIRKIIPMLGISLFLLALLIGVLWANAPAWWFWLLVPCYILMSGRMIYLAYRNNALYVHPDYILYQRGTWTKELTILRPNRIQSLSIRQAIWHQKAGIAHLMIHTAGGTVTFRYGKFREIKTLADYWLYQVEADPKRQEI